MAEVASAFITIAPSMAGFSGKLSSQVNPAVTSVGKSSGLTFGKVFGAVAALGIGRKAFSFMGDAIAEAREAQVVGARTDNVIKSMGLSSTVTSAAIGKLATSISNKTGVDDEAIQSGQNLLLTFGNVAKSAGESNGVFAQTSQLMVDMSAAMGTDAKSAALQLGKALNDPIKGVTALTRSGVSFTEQQKQQITKLTESGHLMKAQGVILGEVGKQFGGAAASMSTPADKARNALNNLKEQIGTALLPVIDKMSAVFSTKIVPAISGFVTGMQQGTGTGGQFASTIKTIGSAIGSTLGFLNQHRTLVASVVVGVGAWKAASVGLSVVQAAQLIRLKALTVGTLEHAVVSKVVSGATKAWAAVQWVLNAALTANPIGLVVAGVAALAVGVVIAYKKSETFRNIVNAAFGAVKKVVGAVVGWFGKYVPNVFGVVVAVVKGYINVYRTVITTAFNVVKSVVGAVGRFIAGSVKFYASFVHAVTDKVGQVVKFFKELPGKIKGFFTGLPDQLGKIGGQIIDGLVSGIRGAAHFVTDAVQKIISAIPDKIQHLMGIKSPSKVTHTLGRHIADGLAQGMLAGAGRVADAAGVLAGTASPQLTMAGGPSGLAHFSTGPTSFALEARTSGSGLEAKIDATNQRLDKLIAVSQAQGREFGRELNGTAANSRRRARR